MPKALGARTGQGWRMQNQSKREEARKLRCSVSWAALDCSASS